MMIHDLDMARFLLGEEPVAVIAAASCLVDPAIGAAGDVDSAVVTLRTAPAVCAKSPTHGARPTGMTSGSRRTARRVCCVPETCADDGGGRQRRRLPVRSRAAVLPGTLRRRLPGGAGYVCPRRVGGEGPARPDGEDGLRALLLADAAEEAARTGATVRPSGDTDDENRPGDGQPGAFAVGRIAAHRGGARHHDSRVRLRQLVPGAAFASGYSAGVSSRTRRFPGHSRRVGAVDQRVELFREPVAAGRGG